MRIVYLGAESANFVIQTCNALCEQGHEVIACVQQVDEYDRENPVKEHENLTRINLEYDKFFNPSYVKSRLIGILAQNKPDIIFGSHAPIVYVVADLAKTYGVPWGIMLLDIPTHTMKTERWRMLQWNVWFDILKHAPIVMFNNTIARDEFYRYTNNWFPDDHIVHYGTHMPSEHELSGLDIEGDYALSICRLHPIKNCKLIPMALSLLKKDLKYVAVGRDSGELGLIKEMCVQNNIEFVYKGTVTEEEKWNLIKNCAMYIYPQDTEYIAGQATLEGMWAGKPVLAGEFDILKELYSDFPFYFDTKSPTSLAKQISFVRSLDKSVIRDNLIEASKHAKNIASYSKMGEGLSNIMSRYVRK